MFICGHFHVLGMRKLHFQCKSSENLEQWKSH